MGECQSQEVCGQISSEDNDFDLPEPGSHVMRQFDPRIYRIVIPSLEECPMSTINGISNSPFFEESDL